MAPYQPQKRRRGGLLRRVAKKEAAEKAPRPKKPDLKVAGLSGMTERLVLKCLESFPSRKDLQTWKGQREVARFAFLPAAEGKRLRGVFDSDLQDREGVPISDDAIMARYPPGKKIGGHTVAGAIIFMDLTAQRKYRAAEKRHLATVRKSPGKEVTRPTMPRDRYPVVFFLD